MAALSAPAWIVCGNYSSVRPLVWGQADTLVWLDYSFPLSFYRLCLRTWRRIVTQEELWGGNRESWRAQLLSRDSLLLYALRTHRRRRVEFALTLGEAEYAHLTVHRFRHPAQAEAWAAGIV